jgi:hypothetical protein
MRFATPHWTMSYKACGRRIQALAYARHPNVMEFVLNTARPACASNRLKRTDDPPYARDLYEVRGNAAGRYWPSQSIWIDKMEAA